MSRELESEQRLVIGLFWSGLSNLITIPGKLSIRENLVMMSPYVRTSVRTLRVEISRNEFLPSLLKSFVLYCFNFFRNDWKIRVCLLSKCLVDFSDRQFDFWGGYGWFQEKVSSDWFRGEKACKDMPGENDILHWKKKIAHHVYNTEKKILHRYMSGNKFLTLEVWEKILTQTKSPIPPPLQKSKDQPHRGWGRSRFDTLVDVTNQMAGARSSCGGD